MRLPLAERTYLTVIPVIALGVLVGLIASTSLKNNARELIEARQIKELAVQSLALLLTQDDASKAMMLDPDNASSGARKIQAYDANTALLQKIGQMAGTPEIREIIRNLAEIDEKQLQPLDTELLEAIGEGKVDAAKQLYFSKYEPARAAYEAHIRRLCDVAEAHAAAAARRLDEKNAGSLQRICTAMGVGCFAVIVITVILVRQITGRLRATVARLKEQAGLTDQSSHEIRRVSQQIASAAETTAVSLESTAASLHEISEVANASATSAGTANTLAGEAAQAAERATHHLGDMEVAMKAIRDSSKAISKIIATIEEIAFQTNILALNAAIEAARAGEAGLGFSVVANEVRNLAARSTQAASETSLLIEAAVSSANRGDTVTRTVADSLVAILHKSKALNEIVDSMTAASGEQSHGIALIHTAVTEVESVTQGNTGHAQRGVIAADDLEQQAAALNQAVEELSSLVNRPKRVKC